ncbi:hypothetical protein EVAR_84567_1 [Eumeta japonica]|uniref:Uncharacterized protein n=1 Tax=Eumeta variegata TaxID=151549 RepID=A0A4C1UIT5_EUMVA|nr:hypothetical protein EVAR_84567_1 [Eumeta japonica]
MYLYDAEESAIAAATSAMTEVSGCEALSHHRPCYRLYWRARTPPTPSPPGRPFLASEASECDRTAVAVDRNLALRMPTKIVIHRPSQIKSIRRENVNKIK